MNKHTRRTRFVGVVALVLGVLMLTPHAALAASKDKQTMFDFATFEQVAGSFSQLDRHDGGVAVKVRTAVAAGHAHTLWYVIFNEPSQCSGGICGEDDLFTAAGDLNVGQIQAASISVVGNTGGVANPAGRLALNGWLAEGEVPSGPGQVVIGLAEDGALAPVGAVTGLVDAATAEIHLVVQDHGVAHEDPALLDQQISSFEGACNATCVDVQFSVHPA